MKNDICVVGGVNMDLVVAVPHIPRPGETVQGGEMQRFPGGKGANQAIAARRLGATVSMIAQLGADAFGNELLKVLGAEGITVDTVGQIHGLSSGVVLISVAANGENAIVVSPGANMVWSHEAVAKVNRAVAGARLLVVNLEVPPSVVATAVRVARAAGGTVILNPAPHRTGNEECFRNVDFFVPNQIEAAVFAGMEPESVDDWRAIGWRLRELGPRNLVITMGAVGALLVSDDGEALCPGFQVPATDTTAAGDAFVGGLSVALLKKLSLPEVVKYVNACGALALTRVGAQPSLPRAAEVEDFIVIV